ncbi:hypothetical protein N7478_006420 [Penicillium angulare]|uniref:uncharacterized protein n=1 Tax=Penicillium angulare TaxID=116970 RepID=UPI0025411A33|nr:uncharacterized protein N7478_006420 [Penicillium angulare]KAJ5281048.1 hypothetical protein N7478_006420 [Penicillium angulare]
MPSVKDLLIPAVLALAMVSNAETITGGLNGNSCPSDWQNSIVNNDARCCYGSTTVEDHEGYCCVHDFSVHLGNMYQARDDSSDCFPFCSITTDGFLSMTTQSCVTKVPFTASDYSSVVSVVSSSLASSSPATNSASQTTTDAAGSTGRVTFTVDSSTGTSTNGAMPLATAEGVVLGAAAAMLFAL